MKQFIAVFMAMCLSYYAFGQTGVILEPGDQVLDPNQDGFISLGNSGFSTDGYDVDEFEIKMFGIPIFGEGEALNDVQSGSPCGVVDLALDTAGYALYAAYDENENLIFRFRLAGNRASVQSYTIFIDTDQLVGPDDPNSSASNPGFEIEITLIHNFGVYIYDVDGIDSCPTPLMAYDVDTHQQKSTSSLESCGDTDIYIDIYVPFDDLTTLFGITPETNVRFAGVTNTSATCALDGSISDIGGVDDVAYDGCFSCAILDLTESQCPSSVSNLCDTCGGFPLGSTETPVINLPVIVGNTQISGTAEPLSEIYIALFSGLGDLIDRDTTLTDEFGDWLSNEFITPLNFEDSIVVNALLGGKCQSGLTDTGLSFAIVSPNQPPQVTGTTQSISYQENSPPIIIASDMAIIDDNVTMFSGSVTLSVNYEEGFDILEARPPTGMDVTFVAAEGKLYFTGEASVADYDSAFRSVTFHSISENPSQEIRIVSFEVEDDLNASSPFHKNILITELNDPPVIIIGTNPVDTIYDSTNEDTPILIEIDVSDVDLDSLEITAYNLLGSNGYIDPAGKLSFIYAPAENYFGTEHINLTVCDDGIPALCDDVIVQVEVLPVNDAPYIVDNGVVIDSLHYTLELGDSLTFCLNLEDIENNDLIVESVNFLSPTTSEIVAQPGLCFDYNPLLGFVGIEEAEITICDTGFPSRCTTAYIEIEVIDSNSPPEITTTDQDTLFFELYENNTLEICLEAIDSDNDPLDFGTIADLFGSGGSIDNTYPCINYTPLENYTGVVNLQATVCDDVIPAKCDEIIIEITVLPFNNPPVVVEETIPVDTILVSTKENTPLEICLDVLDADGDNVSTSEAVTDTGSGSFNIDGSLCVVFIPEPDINEEVWGTVTVCDDGDPESECAQTVIGVEVTPVNIPPEIVLEGSEVDTLYYNIFENTDLDFCIEVFDPDSDSLTVSGTEMIQGEGIFFPVSSEFCFGFSPETDFVGQAAILLSICDNDLPLGCDSVYVIIDVANVNHPPELLYSGVALDTIRVTINENTTSQICTLADDIDGDVVNISELSLLSGEGDISSSKSGNDICFEYTPPLNYFGMTYASVSACDNGSPAECVDLILEIEVLNVNNPPVIYDNDLAVDTIYLLTPARTSINYCVNAIDKDGDNLSLNHSAPAIVGSIQQDIDPFCFEYTPDSEFLGREYFTVTVCDNSDPVLCDEVVVEVEVYSANQAPVILYEGVATDTVYYSTIENTQFSLSFEVEDNPDELILLIGQEIFTGAGELTVSLDQTSVLLDYMPEILSNGTHRVMFNICDNGLPVLCDSLTLLVDVDPLPIFPYEAISPNDDSLNDFWMIDGIEHYPDNIVHIFDRWNNLVFELEGYNNTDRVWRGESNKGLIKADLNDGTYYYKLSLAPRGEVLSGMIILKH